MNNLHDIFREPFKTNVFKMASVNTSQLNRERKWNWRGNGKSTEELHILKGRKLLKDSINQLQLSDILEFQMTKRERMEGKVILTIEFFLELLFK